jgi:hypothetical protein
VPLPTLSLAGTPALWRGSELTARGEWGAPFGATAIAALETAARAADPRPLEALGPSDLGLPDLAAQVSTLQDTLEHGPGVALLRGLPVTEWGEVVTTRAFWAFASHLGTPLSQSAAGERLFHVRDHGYAPDDARFRGPASSRRLSFHTDRCDVIAFCCLRPAREGGDNLVVSSVALYEELRLRQPDVLAVLCEPFPYLRHTVDEGNALPYCQLPVFSSEDGRFAAHFLRVLIDRADRAPDAPSLSQAQRDALDALEALAEDPSLHVRFRLEPGDLLLLNNWTTFHRRDAFTDPVSEARRHVLRVWLSMPNSRPLAPVFAAHFGETAAGALRGGMRPAPRQET